MTRRGLLISVHALWLALVAAGIAITWRSRDLSLDLRWGVTWAVVVFAFLNGPRRWLGFGIGFGWAGTAIFLALAGIAGVQQHEAFDLLFAAGFVALARLALEWHRQRWLAEQPDPHVEELRALRAELSSLRAEVQALHAASLRRRRWPWN